MNGLFSFSLSYLPWPHLILSQTLDHYPISSSLIYLIYDITLPDPSRVFYTIYTWPIALCSLIYSAHRPGSRVAYKLVSLGLSTPALASSIICLVPHTWKSSLRILSSCASPSGPVWPCWSLGTCAITSVPQRLDAYTCIGGTDSVSTVVHRELLQKTTSRQWHDKYSSLNGQNALKYQ